MGQPIEELQGVPVHLQDALFGKGISVWVQEVDSSIFHVSLALPCCCTLVSMTATSDVRALVSIWRALQRRLDEASDVKEVFDEACKCGDVEEMDDLVQIDHLEDGWVRASLVCSLCGQPAITVERADVEDAVDVLWAEAAKAMERTGSPENVKCIRCSSKEGPQRCGHVRHSATGNGRVHPVGIEG